jgi:hypothetical protein
MMKVRHPKAVARAQEQLDRAMADCKDRAPGWFVARLDKGARRQRGWLSCASGPGSIRRYCRAPPNRADSCARH